MALSIGSSVAFAADPPVLPAVAPQPGLEIILAPYVWAASIEGDVGVGSIPAVSIDADFGDIWDALDFAFMGTAEIRLGSFGVFSDLFYVDLSGQSATPLGVIADSVSVDTSLFMLTGAAEYRVVDSPGGSLDLMAGFRVWSVDTTVSIFDAAPPPGNVSGDAEETWLDPLIGVKGQIDLTPSIFLSGWAMAGGFGVSSDFMWDVNAGVGYQFNESISAALGYRAMGVDYSDDDFLFDITQHGPISSFVLKF
jgi:hypothetical protein